MTRRETRNLAHRVTCALAIAVAITSCRRSNAADAGGDSALARDLAIVQMQTAMARDSIARASRATGDSSLAPAESLPSVVAPPPTPADTPADTSAMVTVAEPTSSGTTATAPSVAPSAAPVKTTPAPTRRAAADPCTSASPSSQRACLSVRLAAYDARLNRVYARYIARLRAAPASRGGGEPAIQKLRESERAWVKYRDAMCTRKLAGREGKLWAPARAECLGRYATERAQMLERMLAKR